VKLAHDVLGITPFERPDPALVVALCRAGALGVLDLGRDAGVARRALTALASLEASAEFGLRVTAEAEIAPGDCPPGARVIVLDAGADVARWRPRMVLVQVTSVEEARAAVSAGADGLIAKGGESGGRIGEETSLVLLQRLAAEVTLPIWVQGGIGLHTAGACLAGGARGVVLDSQLALLRESTAPANVRAALQTMDGGETVVADGARFLPARGGNPAVTAAGQDAAFARPLAERYRTVGALIRALRRGVDGHLADARAHRPLDRGSPLAAAHGLRYPIAQGPMTRVSDRAAFADAVSRAGGLPFVALSLMRGAAARDVLMATRDLCGERTWGVGILGFVPPEIREEQLALLQEIRPPVVLIAGGRPSQARPLDALGIATYLHVPSPGLLDMFLSDGARRFVFEGRECGGHVGPRSSFVLWEQQIERLLASGLAKDVSVLFAGGIHDARSAAMVATLAAPLAAAGAKVGVLMGTAYLFTDEAVTTGAIEPGFREAAISCERTVLLETGPGHATRCVETGYVRAFVDEKRRLEADGLPTKDVWAALEQLNLGRLRIAAKGVRRQGAELVPVDAETQAREGMYMIGQVAALRRERCTIAELHADVAEGSTRLLETLRREYDPAGARTGAADVAIVGMACVMPGAKDLGEFWANVIGGVDAVGDVPVQRWNVDTFHDASGSAEGKTVSRWGGFIPPIAFDPLSFGIPPRSLPAIEPVQLLALEVARRALADAGYADRAFERERTSVIFGAEAGTDLSNAYTFRALYPHFMGPLPPALDEHLPKLTEDSFPGVLANVIAGRIANRLDLGGVNYTVDAACAASLAAVDLAVKELRTGTSDMVLCGAADLHNTINDYLLFSSVHALSPTGRCRTFDADADGIVLGEGVACLVLKRLEDAERDGDRVYAVIKGVGGSSDGRSLGLTAPRKEGQMRALDRAYRAAGVSPAEVGLVEAHGTGTVVGDRTELATLTEIFGRAEAAPGSCALGSVKSQIGHTKCAAGLAGVIKAALAIHRQVLPPTLHVRRANPFHERDKSPFTLSQSARPWPARDRKAGVSAFGFGGTNFHVVLASPDGGDEAAASGSRWPAELFLFRGQDDAEAAVAIDALERAVAVADTDAEPQRLADLARTVSLAGQGPVQAAVVASSVDDLRAKLVALRAGKRDRRGVFFRRGKPGMVAFLFPGQGSQRPGMLGDLFVAFPWLQDILRLGTRWARVMHPATLGAADESTAHAAALTDTRVAQPALGMADRAMARLLGALGVKPDAVAGHSYGELPALATAGVITDEQLLALSEARARCILAAAGVEPGTMAAVSASAAAVERAIAGVPGVVIANINAPEQTVVAGSGAAIDAALGSLSAAGLSAKKIPVACAFHSPIVAGAVPAFRQHLDGVPVGTPAVPVWSNTTAAPYPADAEGVRSHLARQIGSPVRFADQIEAMYASGVRVFVEVGPGQVLTGLTGRILGGRPHTAIACDRAGEPGVSQLLVALAELAVEGVPIDPAALWEGRDARVVDLKAPRRASVSASAWLVDGQLARPVSGEVPAGALRPVTHLLGAEGAAALPPAETAARPTSDRDATVVDFLRSMREMVDAQRQVMLRFLGEMPAAQDQAALPARPAAASHVQPAAPAPAAAGVHANGKSTARAPEAVAAVAAASVAAEPAGIATTLLAIVSERTGYPIEMLGLDLDLEAELSIDSIKRVEILGALTTRLGLQTMADQSRDAIIERLATVKTLRGIVEWLERSGAPAPTLAAAVPPPPASPAVAAAPAPEPQPAPPPAADAPAGVSRYVLSLQAASPVHEPNGGAEAALRGRRLVLVPDTGDIARHLIPLLAARGAAVRMLTPGEGLGEADGLLYLASLAPDPGRQSARALFDLLRGASGGGLRTVIAATGMGGALGRRMNGTPPRPGGGVSGLLKSAAKEWPHVRARVVDLDPDEAPDRLAGHLVDEIGASDDLLEVGYSHGRRQVLTPLPAPHQDDPARGGVPPLDTESVVLLTGGARGITARIAVAMAHRFRCRFVLVGRSPQPPDGGGGDEDADIAAASDMPSLRRVLARRGLGGPAAIEAAGSRILAARDLRRTLAAIRDAGGQARYHTVDVRDAEAFGSFLDQLYASEGHIDGVVHGAGVLEDKLIPQKTPESWSRVFDTKVSAALTLSEKLRSDVRFVAFFSSVSGVFGNRGQSDYAAANDALDKIALALGERLPGRVVSIAWGPWAGGGMVAPELAREYARRGMSLLDPDAGVTSFMDEIWGGPREVQVLLMGAGPDGADALQPFAHMGQPLS